MRKAVLLSFASMAVMSMALAAMRDANAQTSTSTSTSSSAAGANSSSTSGAAANNRGNAQNITFNSPAVPTTTTSNVNDRVSGGTSSFAGSNSWNGGDQTIRSAPTVYVPNVVTGNVCGLGASAGASWLGAGLAVGASWESQQCERRQQAALLHNAGYKQAARELMCDQHEVYDAMRRAGTPCLPRPAWDGPVAQAAPTPVMQQVPMAPPVVTPAPAPAPMVQRPVPRCNPARGINDNCYSG